jgi:DnaJ-domain-containing protein 1
MKIPLALSSLIFAIFFRCRAGIYMAILLSLLAGFFSAWGQDSTGQLNIKTRNGKVFTDCHITNVTPDGIVIKCNGSNYAIRYQDLPPEVQCVFSYDPSLGRFHPKEAGYQAFKTWKHHAEEIVQQQNLLRKQEQEQKALVKEQQKASAVNSVNTYNYSTRSSANTPLLNGLPPQEQVTPSKQQDPALQGGSSYKQIDQNQNSSYVPAKEQQTITSDNTRTGIILLFAFFLFVFFFLTIIIYLKKSFDVKRAINEQPEEPLRGKANNDSKTDPLGRASNRMEENNWQEHLKSQQEAFARQQAQWQEQKKREAEDAIKKAREAEQDLKRKREEEQRAREQKRKDESSRKSNSSAPTTKNGAYYGKVLGLVGKVTMSDVKKKYRELVSQYHPDKVNHLGDKLKKVAEQEMKEINEAYEYFKRMY